MSLQKGELPGGHKRSYNSSFQDIYKLRNCTINDAYLPPVTAEIKALLQMKVLGKIVNERKLILLYELSVWFRYYKPIFKPLSSI